jgi:hypothetical protein
VHARIDPVQFAVTGAMDVLQGAITPTVRRPYCEVAPDASSSPSATPR